MLNISLHRGYLPVQKIGHFQPQATSVNAQNTRSPWESEQNTRSLWESEPATSVNAQNTRSHWEKESLRESQPSKLAVGSQIVSHILRMWRLMIPSLLVIIQSCSVPRITEYNFKLFLFLYIYQVRHTPYLTPWNNMNYERVPTPFPVFPTWPVGDWRDPTPTELEIEE